MDYLPEVYQEFQRRFPDVSGAYARLAETCHKEGRLDEKTRELVQLGIAIGLSSEGAVRSHTRRALDAGVTAEGIRSAVLLSLTSAGFPAMIAAMKWADEVIAKR
jgi:4-carboxymuconolactone decarboxylase